MSAEPTPKMLPQVTLLLLALCGWTAFVFTFFALISANHEIRRRIDEADEIRAAATAADKEKDAVIQLLELKVRQLEPQPQQ